MKPNIIVIVYASVDRWHWARFEGQNEMSLKANYSAIVVTSEKV